MASPNDALATLFALYNSTAHVEVKSAAAEGIGIAGGPEARTFLISALQNTAHAEIKAALARALGRATHR